MPKVIFGEENRRNAAMRELIDSCIGRGQRYKTLVELAEAMKMPYTTLRSKYRDPEKFRFDEMCALIRVTKSDDRSVARLFGVKYRGGIAEKDAVARRASLLLENNTERKT